jgi:hypothetical protein
MRIIFTTILFLALIVLGAYIFWPKTKVPQIVVSDYESCVQAGYKVLETYPEQCQTPSGNTFIKSQPTPSENPPKEKGPIVVSNITDNQVVKSPFVVKGEAIGGWYFEASFPIWLLDANNKKIAETYATAQGDWMTTSYVPFVSQEIKFTTTSKTGTLVLHNDNASGLPENDREIRIPVRFEEAQKTIKLYYYNSSKDKDTSGNILCSAKGLVAVNRTVPVTITPIQDAIKLLMDGSVTAEESKAGIISNFPLPGVTLQAASLDNEVLTLTFTDPQHSTSGGACKINVLRAQIEATAKQFPGVTSVRIMPATLFQP